MHRLLPGMILATLLVSGLQLTAEEEKGKPRPQKLTGTLTKVDGAALTVTTRGDSGERSEVFTTDAGTKIVLETAQDETVQVKGEGGNVRVITRPKTAAGKLADLKVGQRVSVTHAGDKKASEVVSHRAAKARKEGER